MGSLTNTITDKRFLIGLAVGYLVVPRLAKNVRPLLDKLKGG
jgi:hypothetical protein